MTDSTVPGVPAGASHPGSRLGRVNRRAAIYGALLVTTLVAAESRFGGDVERLALSIIIAAVVFWLMEVWSDLVDKRVEGPITVAETVEVGRHASPMVAAAILPTLALMLPRLGMLTVDQALDTALVLCVVQLFVWGLLVGRAMGRGWVTALMVAVGDSALGLLIVSLKVLVIH